MMVNYEQDERARHGLNLKAVIFAGLVVGVLFILVPRGHPWSSQSLPTHAMGRPLFEADAANVFVITGLVQMAMALAYTFVVAGVTYWMRITPAIVSAAIVGALLYALNYLTFRFLIPEAPPAAESTVALVHIGFCMMAAGAYKGFAIPRPRKTEQPA